ncbi:MAG: peptidoglycan D,D-transpeptidase FtsI family protein [Desertimonas sp.]
MATDRRAARLGVLALVATLLFSALGVRLWFLQTVESASLQEQVDRTRQVSVKIPPERGRIFDVTGRILADNRGAMTASVDWAAIRRDADRATIFQRLSGWLEVPVEEMEARYDSDLYSRYIPLPLAEDVPEEVAIALRERIEDFPGLTISTTWERVYPYAPLASHVIGYMGAITKETQEYYSERGYDTSNRGERVGASGLEESYEAQLHGQWGEIVYEIDSANRIVRTVSSKPPVNGQDLQISMDLSIQYYAERLLITQLRNRRLDSAANPEVTYPNGQRGPLDRSMAAGTRVHYPARAGSIVAIDQNTGAVLAMASYPTYDNRWFNAGLSEARFNELFPADIRPDEARLINRAIQGQYNMGSTFKLFTAYAALAIGILGPSETYNDQGEYRLQTINEDRCAEGVRCVFRNAICSFNNRPCVYGTVDVEAALAVSSDTFFYRLGEIFYNIDGTPFQDTVHQLGLDEDPGIDLPNAFDGRLATNDLQARLADAGVLGDNASRTLQPGDLLQMAIGQGISAISPLHLAVGYAAVANGGTVVTPHVGANLLAPETPDDPTRPGYADLTQATVVETVAPVGTTAPMPAGTRDPIVAGMRRNVTGPGANGRTTTAEELFDVGYPADAIPVGGKTGTAQGADSLPWNDSSVFAAFSLDPDPARQITITSYLEKAGYGSVGAAPVVKCMYLAFSGLIPLDEPPIADPLDLDDDVAAHDLPEVDEACMARSATANSALD